MKWVMEAWGAVLKYFRPEGREDMAADDVRWIVNDIGELGVEVNGRCFFLYKGESLEYEDGLHDDGTSIMYRPVGKREFGETCWPLSWVRAGRREDRYTTNLVFHPGLSFGKPEDAAWRPLPVPRRPSKNAAAAYAFPPGPADYPRPANHHPVA